MRYLSTIWRSIKKLILGEDNPMRELIPPEDPLPILPSKLGTTFIIDRETWSRGEKHKGCLLRPQDGKRCCLGFYCKKLGATDEEMLNVATPKGLLTEVQQRIGIWDSWMYDANPFKPTSRDLYDIISFNDRKVGDLLHLGQEERMTEELREKMLTDRFAKHNVSVIFIN